MNIGIILYIFDLVVVAHIGNEILATKLVSGGAHLRLIIFSDISSYSRPERPI
jgi:hypothetical protein